MFGNDNEELENVKLVADFDGANVLALGLEVLRGTQESVSQFVPGATNIPPMPHQIQTYGLALTQEVHELINEFGWKPWKSENERDVERLTDEFADILAFLGLFVYYLNAIGITPMQLASGYRKKSIENVGRFLGLPDSPYRGTITSEEVRKSAIQVIEKLSE